MLDDTIIGQQTLKKKIECSKRVLRYCCIYFCCPLNLTTNLAHKYGISDTADTQCDRKKRRFKIQEASTRL